jgi:DNA-binding LacI/PurR family transcriptional regulator
LGFVDVDAISGAEGAVTHLLEMGHQRIGIITNAPLSYTSAQQRCLGYRNALEQRNIGPESSLIKEGNYTPASGYHAMQELLAESPRPSAVFVASDVVAVGAILAARRLGLRIPEDVAIVGFDDIPMAEYLDPPLTTVRLPAFGLGWAAGERLVRLIRGERLDQTGIFLESQLIIRDSTNKT